MESIKRPLGAFEKVFWLLDQVSQVHFVMAAEISGSVGIADLRRALNAIQVRHPLFSVHIERNGDQNPLFVSSDYLEIPLRVVPKISADRLDIEMAREVSVPFDWSHPPLVRAVLLEDDQHPVIILAVHHAISDGLSLSLVIRDLLEVLSGKAIDRLTLPRSMDEILNLTEDREPVNAIKFGSFTKHGLPERRHELMPVVKRIKISKEVTDTLIVRARQEGTTVHGALYAAFVIVLKKLNPDWEEKEMNIINPLSVRLQIGAGEDCCLYIGSKKITQAAGDAGLFWDLARYVNSEMKDVHLMETVQHNTQMMHDRVFAELDIRQLSDALQSGVGRDLMITNLGRVPYDTTFGDLKLESVWGPVVLSGTAGEHTIGAVTVGGELCLSVVSRSPLASLLSLAVEELEAACSLAIDTSEEVVK